MPFITQTSCFHFYFDQTPSVSAEKSLHFLGRGKWSISSSRDVNLHQQRLRAPFSFSSFLPWVQGCGFNSWGSLQCLSIFPSAAWSGAKCTSEEREKANGLSWERTWEVMKGHSINSAAGGTISCDPHAGQPRLSHAGASPVPWGCPGSIPAVWVQRGQCHQRCHLPCPAPTAASASHSH